MHSIPCTYIIIRKNDNIRCGRAGRGQYCRRHAIIMERRIKEANEPSKEVIEKDITYFTLTWP